MHRLEDGKAEQRRNKDGQYLAHVGAEQELDRLADVVVDAAAFLNRANDGGKVVVGKHHVRHVLGDVGARDAHADADVGGFDRGRVVHAVAGHRGDIACAAPCVDNAGLVFGLYARVNRDAAEHLFKLRVAHRGQLRAGDCALAAFENAQLLGDRRCRVDVVAGDHDRADARTVTFFDRCLDFRAHGVDHADQPDKAELVFQRRRFGRGGRAVVGAQGSCQHAQRAVCHCLVRRENLRAHILGHRHLVPVLDVARAAAQNLVRRALGVLHHAAAGIMQRGHHLAPAVKRRFAHAREFAFQLGLFQPQLCRIGNQRCLGRLAGDAAVGIQLRVGAERHRRGKQAFVFAVVIHHGHLILRQRAGFVRADDLRAAQRLHRGQTADDGIAL